MCGIIGYTGSKQAVPILMEGLGRLEYRGYDSSGIAVFDENGLTVVKCRGRLAALQEKLKEYQLKSGTGIGHTRWATHGEPNDINSHPHISYGGRIAMVHNGIIENYIALREFLKAAGYCFVSETDTEVVAHLIDYYYTGDLAEAVFAAIEQIEGSYALGVLCREHPGMMVAARKDSPLIIGLGEGENFIASDIPAIYTHTREIIILEDQELAILTPDGVRIMNHFRKEIHKTPFHVGWDVSAAERGGYEHFMMKEIYEEPRAVRDTLSPRIRGG
ncbi:MAG TPA: glutamine--fructose-6-phosphate aminotransferase, partial [Clostridiales bacterium]|nr:glutamine--fructose-6-phosphate aminotransferase [Clostridiales bacterium]